ncbi:MAG: MBL fold metallo-hydrolase [Nitrososphaerota archaeon]|nr:MBL fold metallo-hydrolase [Nitrososphaerota archaeon]
MITFLGTSGGLVVNDRSCAGVLVDNTLLDCGFGVLKNIRRFGIPLDRVDRILISHTHADHCGDFVGIIWAMALERREKPVQVVGSSDTLDRLHMILDIYGTPRELLRNLKVIWDPLERAGVEHCEGIHFPENHAYRLDDGGKSAVYTGDTAMSNRITDFARGADTLIHESTFRGKDGAFARLTNHSTAPQAAMVAHDAGVKRLVLTHFTMPPADIPKALVEAKKIFPNTTAANDGLVLHQTAAPSGTPLSRGHTTLQI